MLFFVGFHARGGSRTGPPGGHGAASGTSNPSLGPQDSRHTERQDTVEFQSGTGERQGLTETDTFQQIRNRTNPDRQQRDAGAGTVFSLGLCLAVITLLLAVLALAQATIGAARAGAAADLAALAGADTIRALRAGDPCTVAAEVAARNGAELGSCAPDVGALSITVDVASSAGRLLPWAPSARARAGPPGSQWLPGSQ